MEGCWRLCGKPCAAWQGWDADFAAVEHSCVGVAAVCARASVREASVRTPLSRQPAWLAHIVVAFTAEEAALLCARGRPSAVLSLPPPSAVQRCVQSAGLTTHVSP